MANSLRRFCSPVVPGLAVALLALAAVATVAAAMAATPAIGGGGGVVGGPSKRGLGIMDCDERCESRDIKLFKAYWWRNFPQVHFIDFLRDMVVYSALFEKDFRDFKSIVDREVQKYEICRYVTCSTDYMG